MSSWEGGMDCSFSLREDRFGFWRPMELWVMHMINARYVQSPLGLGKPVADKGVSLVSERKSHG